MSNNIYYQRPNNSGKKSNNSASQQHDSYYQPGYQARQYETNRRVLIHSQSAGKDLAANIVLVLLSITLVIGVITLCSELRYINSHREQDANSFWWNYDSGRYVDNIKYMYENKINDVRENTELTQCYAVAEYFEAASLYKAYVIKGNADKAQKYLEVMAKAYSEMGDVSYLAEDIDAKLGIAEVIN